MAIKSTRCVFKRRKDGNRKRKYGIMMRQPDGTLLGFIDQSTFSMGWSPEAIYLWDEPPYHYMPGAIKNRGTNSESMIENDARFIVRLHSKTCPVTIHYDKRWPRRSRNHSFTLKEAK